MNTSRPLRILVMDDAPEVRQTVKGFFASAGHVAEEVGTTRELIPRLAERAYDVICLDIVLSNDITIEETHELVRKYFPKVSIQHDEILEDLGVSERATVSGLYLLPIVKAIAPGTKVIMLTAAWDGEQVEQHLRKWGSEVTVLKCGEDREFRSGNTLLGLDAELRDFVESLAEDVTDERASIRHA